MRTIDTFTFYIYYFTFYISKKVSTTFTRNLNMPNNLLPINRFS